MKKIFIFLFILFLFGFCPTTSAHQPQLIYFSSGDIQIENPEISRAFYDELKGSPRIYYINSVKDFNLYINILVPNPANKDGRYSAKIYKEDELIATIDGNAFEWQNYYEEFGRDYYLKGPEFEQNVLAGNYKIEVYFADPPEGEAGNLGKYVLAVGKTELFDAKTILNVYWQLPLLKIDFFKTSVLQFFLTPFAIAGVALIGGVILLLAIISYVVSVIKIKMEQKAAKTILLTSAGMQVKDEIIKLLQKPAYDITVAFITTAAKQEADISFIKKDWDAMKEIGFNVEEIDIEGKTENQVSKILEFKDIVFVEGGNADYLLKAMKACNFKKVIKKLLKQGKVYIGAGEGSVVAGRKGLKLVPFDIFVHYLPEYDEVIKAKIKNSKKRKKFLKILTDDQAILVQSKETILIGKWPEIVV